MIQEQHIILAKDFKSEEAELLNDIPGIDNYNK